MTILGTTNRINYTSVGEITFAYPFLILVDSDLQVYDNGVLKVLGVDYTVTGVGSATGGNVVFTVATTAGHSIVFIRVEPFTQASDLPTNDKFPSDTVETALDKLTMIVQQLNEVDQRTVKLALTSLFTGITLDDPVIGKFLRWKSNTEIEPADIASTLGLLGIPVSIAQGGTGRTNVGSEGTVAAAVAGTVAYLSPGYVSGVTNRTGHVSVFNEIVVASLVDALSVISSTTIGDTRPVLVCDDPGQANLAATRYAQRGIHGVLTTGVIAVGDYLRVSGTSGRCESAGATKVAGAFAMAMGSSGGGLSAINALLFGDTQVSTALPAYTDSVPRDNLIISHFNNAVVTVTADGVKMLDGTGASRIKRGLAVSVDITTTGLNGRDTVTAEAGSKGYWIWAVSNGATDGCILVPDSGGASADAPSSSIYTCTYKLLVGWVYNDAGSNFVPFAQKGARFSYRGDSTDGPRIVFTAKVGVAAYTAESLAAIIPGSTVAAVQGTVGLSTALADFAFAVAATAAGEHASLAHGRGDGVTAKMNWLVAVPFDIPWVSGINIYWRTGGVTAIYRLGIRGFEFQW